MTDYRITRNRKAAFNLSESVESPMDLYDHLPFQIAVVSNLLQLNRDLEIREIADLEPRELRVILNIGSYMPIKAADIAYQSRMDSYTVSRAVKVLKSLDMIESNHHEENRKVKYLTLTDKGAEVYRDLCHAIDRRTEKLEECLSDDEKSTLMNLLAKLEDQAEQLLADNAKARQFKGESISADQKEIIRWSKKSAY